jgi:branched-chain amino acid transport system substrate-binding protein
MAISRRGMLGTAAVAMAALPLRPSRAQTPKIKIGVLTDLSGPYRDLTGPTSVACVRQAVEDFGLASKGFDVEVVSADHQNKADVGAAIARRWIDNEAVDALADVPNSGVALAVAQIARQKDKILLAASPSTVALTGSQCSPNTVVWCFDTYMLAKSTGGAMVKSGGDSWFFITANYTFGHSLEEQTTDVVRKAGGKVLGASRYPFPETTDFSQYLQQAQASGAKVLGLATAGADTVNCIKQAHEFGLTQRGMQIAPLLIFTEAIRAIGLEFAQDLHLTEAFYWDLNERTRAFAKRVLPKVPNNWPNMPQASAYGITLHYLKAVADLGPAEAKRSGAATVARMKQMPTDDDAFGSGYIREDGRGMFPAYLFEVKKPSESKSSWDLYKLAATTPAEEAVRPLNEGGCLLVHV